MTQLQYILNLTKLQKPELLAEAGKDCKENQNLVFNSVKPKRKQNKQTKTSLLPKLQRSYNILVPCLLQFSVQIFIICGCLISYMDHIFWNISCSSPYYINHTIINIYMFVVYLLMQALFTDKIHFFNFLFSSDKPWLDQVKTNTVLLLVSWYKLLLEVLSVQGRGNTNKEW